MTLPTLGQLSNVINQTHGAVLLDGVHIIGASVVYLHNEDTLVLFEEASEATTKLTTVDHYNEAEQCYILTGRQLSISGKKVEYELTFCKAYNPFA